MSARLKAACEVRTKYELEHPPDCVCRIGRKKASAARDCAAPQETRHAVTQAKRSPPHHVPASPSRNLKKLTPEFGVPCAILCNATGDHVRQGLLHQTSRFTVSVRDAAGQLIRRGGDKIRVSSRGPGPLRTGVSDQGDGHYIVTYHATVSGAYTLSVSCNSSPISGSPFTINVEPSAASAPHCVAEGAGLRFARAGEPAEFIIRAHDESGRAKIMGGEPFEVRAVPTTESTVRPGEPTPSTQLPVHDEGNGSYTVRYCLPVSGRYELHVQLSQAPVRGSPFALSVTPGRSFGAACLVTGDGAHVATAGRMSECYIECFDRNGNTLRGVGATRDDSSFSALLRPKHVQGESTPQRCAVRPLEGGGAFIVQYLTTCAGEHELEVRLSGELLPQLPKVTVLPAETCVSSSMAYGDALSSAVAGVSSSFTIIARDAFGNARDCLGDEFEVVLKPVVSHDTLSSSTGGAPDATLGGARGEVAGQVWRKDDGTAGAAVTPSQAGIGAIEVTLDGRHISGSPFHTRIYASDAVGRNSMATGAGVHSAVAGEVASFTVQARDAYGNLSGIDEPPSVSLAMHRTTSKASPPTELPADRSRMVRGEAIGVGEGRYEASYCVASAGEYLLEVCIGGEHVAGSPFRLVVSPTAAEPSCCQVVRAAPQQLQVATWASLSFESRDCFGNLRAGGGDRFDVSLVGLNEQDTREPERLFPPTLLDEMSGLYTVSYGSCRAGELQLHVLLRGEHICGSPFALTAVAAQPTAQHCIAHGPGLQGGVCGRTTRFGVLLRDGFSNACVQDAHGLQLLLRGPAELRGQFEEQPDGSLAAAMQPTVAGRYWAHLTLHGQHVHNSPFGMHFDAAEATATSSSVLLAGLQELSAGTPAPLFVDLRDEWGNPSASSSANLLVNLVPPAQPARMYLAVQAEEEAAGVDRQCSCSLQPPDQDGVIAGVLHSGYAGMHMLHVQLCGEHLPGSPFCVTVAPGTVHAPSTSIHLLPSEGLLLNEKVTIRILARDRFRNLTSQACDFHVFVRGAARATEQRLVNLAAGEYELVLRLPLSGQYEVSITNQKLHVRGSPLALRIDGPERTTAERAALNLRHRNALALDGERTSAMAPHSPPYHPASRDGGARQSAGAPSPLPRCATGRPPTPPSAGPSFARGAIRTPNSRGGRLPAHELEADGQPSTPIGKWLAEGSGLHRAEAGVVNEFRVFRHGPHEELEPSDLVVRTELAQNVSSSSAVLPPASPNGVQLRQTSSSSLHASYTVERAGIWRLHVAVKSTPVEGSPFSVHVAPGAVVARISTAQGRGLIKAVCGEEAAFVVTARDRWGNRLTRGGSLFAASLAARSALQNPIPCEMVDCEDGTYLGVYVPLAAGEMTLSVQMDGCHISGSPFFVAVCD